MEVKGTNNERMLAISAKIQHIIMNEQFVMFGNNAAEHIVRAKWPGGESTPAEFIRYMNSCINVIGYYYPGVINSSLLNKLTNNVYSLDMGNAFDYLRGYITDNKLNSAAAKYFIDVINDIESMLKLFKIDKNQAYHLITSLINVLSQL